MSGFENTPDTEPIKDTYAKMEIEDLAKLKEASEDPERSRQALLKQKGEYGVLNRIDDYISGIQSPEKIQKRIDQLLEQSHGRAVNYNERYDQLRKNLTDAYQALKDFEQQELGLENKN